jgi:lipoprotein-anchoring transpeptidase ErfK/SrfK
VGLGARVFRLQPKRVGLALDARRTAQRAYHAGLTATPGASSRPVALAINYSHQALTAFVATIARRVDVAPRSARFHIALVHQRLRRQRDGHFVNQRSLRARLAATLLDPAAPHQLQQRLLASRARVTVNTLRRRYATLITIDRAHFKLRLFKRLHWVKTYEIAVGMAGLATPTGVYHVQEKQVNPSWHVPNSSWAGSLAGQTIPPGPNDPIKARWLGLGGGVGIHGTAESFSIGSRASHGCIRMLVPDVIALYRRVPLGTPVYIR